MVWFRMIHRMRALALLYLALTAPAQSALVFSTGATWKYLKGTAEASSPSSAWRLPGFNDASWLTGPTPLGYGEPTVTFGTTLADMPGGYSTIYLRRTFTVSDVSAIGSLAAARALVGELRGESRDLILDRR